MRVKPNHTNIADERLKHAKMTLLILHLELPHPNSSTTMSASAGAIAAVTFFCHRIGVISEPLMYS